MPKEQWPMLPVVTPLSASMMASVRRRSDSTVLVAL